MRVKNERGYTLLELVIVVSVVALIAAIAVPGSTSGPDQSLELAADSFAAAMRFARRESIRTGEPYGFRQQSGAKRIRVFRLDQGTNPATIIYDVYHPIDKQIYDIDLNVASLAKADSLNRTVTFRGTCNQTGNIYFDSSGTPWCVDLGTTLVTRFELEMTSGSQLLTVELDPITGRVTVQ